MLEKMLASLPSPFDSLIFVTLTVTLLVIISEYAPQYREETTFTFQAVNRTVVKSVPGFQKLRRATRLFACGWIASICLVFFGLSKDIIEVTMTGQCVYVLVFLSFWIYLAIPTIMASLSLLEWLRVRAAYSKNMQDEVQQS